MRDGHGDDLHRYERIRANFSSNVTSLTNPTSLREYLRGEIDRIGSYPEPTAASLGKSLAKHHGLADGEVLVTSGATEGIYLIAQAYRELVHYYSPDPTFSEYRDAGRLFAREQRELETFEPGQDAPAGVYWLCSPNNPMGQVYSQDFLESLWSRYPQIYFVIDSSYSYFTEAALPDPQETIRRFPNVIFVASLTKRYAMPGLRLGYVMAHSEVNRPTMRIRCAVVGRIARHLSRRMDRP